MKHFHSWKYTWKCRLRNGVHFSLGLNVLNVFWDTQGAVFCFRYFLNMPCSSTTVSFLLLWFDLILAQAEIFLAPTRREHEASVAIIGKPGICVTACEAVGFCDGNADCRGIWFYKKGRKKCCAPAICPSAAGTLNPIPEEAGVYFRSHDTFERGN